VIISRSGESVTWQKENNLAKKIAGEFGAPVYLTPHLYHIPEEHEIWNQLREIEGDLAVLSSLYPRPMEWLLRKHGVGRAQIVVWDTENTQEMEDALSRAPAAGTGEVKELNTRTISRWYPVVDRSRCDNCLHCLHFCLFGVYELDENGHSFAAHPDKCKPGCPACSRICPNGAIMFPLYSKDAAIAGAPGLIMQPDPMAKKMFYTRTESLCPVCGQSGKVLPVRGDTNICKECSRPLHEEKPSPKSDALDELDSLIDALDSRFGSRE
jgi:NAD-dependent dihydropyrimidine dehydrogenase PreA subunit